MTETPPGVRRTGKMTAVDASRPDPDPLQPLLDELGVPASDVDEANRRGPAARAALVATRAVLPAQPCLTPRQVWEQAGVDEGRAKALWRGPGLPRPRDRMGAPSQAAPQTPPPPPALPP